MILVTGASGQLGHLVIQNLLKQVPATQIAALVRTPAKAQDLATLGVELRQGDYEQPETLDRALQGVEKVLLISSSEVGKRYPQHVALIDAAKRAGVKLLAYTSILRADSSPLPLAAEHKATEEYLKTAGVPYVLLRNGWYTENYTASVPAALQLGAVYGAAGDGRIASAARADYAAAAAQVLVLPDQAGKVYELAGDTAYTLTELAAEIARQTGKAITYQNIPEVAYQQALVGAGLPEGLATLLAESDTGASKGGLYDDGKVLSGLIGRPTTPLATLVTAALKG
ncbi:SDR family oxidoreductase [Holophaga foetida]|uniref:SDR family oxidoreductase n=1 Tax=Holophaga foetida TaxID=35839 RepID=UPI00024746AE|nr:SDR family oxidoreductase [Holophaga foetida]